MKDTCICLTQGFPRWTLVASSSIQLPTLIKEPTKKIGGIPSYPFLSHGVHLTPDLGVVSDRFRPISGSLPLALMIGPGWASYRNWANESEYMPRFVSE